MGDLSREEFQSWMTLLRGDVQGVHDRLDELNGRTRDAERKIAVLEDRGSRDNGARWTAGLTALGGVVHWLIGGK